MAALDFMAFARGQQAAQRDNWNDVLYDQRARSGEFQLDTAMANDALLRPMLEAQATGQLEDYLGARDSAASMFRLNQDVSQLPPEQRADAMAAGFGRLLAAARSPAEAQGITQQATVMAQNLSRANPEAAETLMRTIGAFGNQQADWSRAYRIATDPNNMPGGPVTMPDGTVVSGPQYQAYQAARLYNPYSTAPIFNIAAAANKNLAQQQADARAAALRQQVQAANTQNAQARDAWMQSQGYAKGFIDSNGQYTQGRFLGGAAQPGAAGGVPGAANYQLSPTGAGLSANLAGYQVQPESPIGGVGPAPGYVGNGYNFPPSAAGAGRGYINPPLAGQAQPVSQYNAAVGVTPVFGNAAPVMQPVPVMAQDWQSAPWWSREYVRGANQSDLTGLDLERQRAAMAAQAGIAANDPVQAAARFGVYNPINAPGVIPPAAPAWNPGPTGVAGSALNDLLSYYQRLNTPALDPR